MRERDIQKSVVGYARDRGLICIKLAMPGARGTAGWPDYLMLGHNRSVLFIEFKRPGKLLTRLQAHRAAQLTALGFSVMVVDDVEGGRVVVDALNSQRYYRHPRRVQ